MEHVKQNQTKKLPNSNKLPDNTTHNQILPEAEWLFPNENNIYRIMIDEMNEGAVTLNSAGIILYCNRSFARLVKCPKDEIIYSKLSCFLSPEEQSMLGIIKHTEFQGPVSMSLQIQDTENQFIPTNVKLFKITNLGIDLFLMTVMDERERLYARELNSKHMALQNLASRLKSAREEAEQAVRLVKEKNFDIAKLNSEYISINHALETANKELLLAKQKAETSDRLKSAFIANMSHEIRTPLNSILGYTKMLLEHCYDDEQRENIEVIIRSSGHLLNLINDIVDLSRLEADELSIMETDVSLSEIMHDMEKQFIAYGINHNKQHIEFRLQMPRGAKKRLAVKTDESRVKQVLSNILSNAFKYTHEGCIEFGYDLHNDKEVIFFVRDTGTGISTEDQDIIFNRFQQGKNPGKKAVSGTGLGLAISKGLASLLGGQIWLESREGYGSTFYFTIPLKQVITHVRKKKQPVINTGVPQLKGKRILVSEDDFYSREMMIYLLRKTEVFLEVAKDGEETLRKYNKGQFDLLLLDIRLPEIDGYEVLQRIRAKNPNIVVIAQTAYAMLDDLRKFKQAGFTDYITKPINDQKLYSLLHKYLC
jgi:signal transduction histidine kinase